MKKEQVYIITDSASSFETKIDRARKEGYLIVPETFRVSPPNYPGAPYTFVCLMEKTTEPTT